MKNILLVLLLILIIGCKGEDRLKLEESKASDEDSVESPLSLDALENSERIDLNLTEANKLAQLPLACLNTQYPNKPGQILSSEEDLQLPRELHPAFYGCFDWHSSVHAHWSLVRLLKKFPELEQAEVIKEKLKSSLSKDNIAGEMAYFQQEHNRDFERTYGWAWLLKLAEELHTWDTDLGTELSENLQPLTGLIVERYLEFFPKLSYPIRAGEHSNTAFALSFGHDYAIVTQNEELRALIDKRAKEFYLSDDNCPVTWEPSGFDFLSPCLQEIDIMRKLLPKAAFSLWIDDFMPQLKSTEFTMEPVEVSDRTDGKLVHLDGLNYSRAWVLYGLSIQYPDDYSHLNAIANQHLSSSFPNLIGDTYEGGHWLGSFALYALEESKPKK